MTSYVANQARYLTNTNVVDSMINLLGYDMNNYFIIRDEKAKIYKAFSSLEDYEAYFAETKKENRCFHEVVFGDMPQRIKFDIDCPKEYMDKLDVDVDVDVKKEDVVAKIIGKMIIKVFNESYKSELEKYYFPTFVDNILITQSHAKNKKYSFHIILTGFKLPNCRECALFTDKVCARIPIDIANIVDKQVNGSCKTLRLLGCTKNGEERYKRISSKCQITDDKGYIQWIRSDYDIKHCFMKKKNLSQSVLSENIIQSAVDKVREYFPEFKFRDTKENYINFDRLYPSKCDICDKRHDKDNTLIVYYANDSVYYQCRHDTSELKTTQKLLEFEKTKYDRDVALKNIVENSEVSNPLIRYTDHTEFYDKNYVKDITDVETEFIRAPMKLGKTKTLRKYINGLKPDVSICILSFRLTFSHNIQKSLNDFVLYSDIKESKITSRIAPRVIVQIESLYRLIGKYDVVILDESESILSQFGSGNVRNSSIAFANFAAITTLAAKVICMDAFMTERTVEVINRIRNKPYKIMYNSYQNACEYNYNLCHYQNNTYMYDKIVKALEDGENIAIMANKKTDLENIKDLIANDFPDIDIGIYTANTDIKIKKEHMSDVNKYWKNKRVILYTPTITAGISFEEEWFDQIFALFTNRSCDVLTCMQMLGRIRNVKSKNITIAFDVQSIYCPITRDAIYNDLTKGRLDIKNGIDGIRLQPNIEFDDDDEAELNSEQLYKVDQTDHYYILWSYNQLASNISKRQFIQYMCKCIKETGASISVHNSIEGDFNKRATECKKLREEVEAKAIALTELIDDDDAEALYQKFQDNEELDREEQLQYYKYRLKIAYDIEEENEEVLDTVQFVLSYNNDADKNRYKNLKYIFVDPNVDVALSQIQRIDKKELSRRSKMDNQYKVKMLSYKSKYLEHFNTISAIRYLGFKHLLSLESISKTDMENNVNKNKKKLREIYTFFEIYPPSLTDKYDAYVKKVDVILHKIYGFHISAAKGENAKYKIKLPTKFAIKDSLEDEDEEDNDEYRPTILIG